MSDLRKLAVAVKRLANEVGLFANGESEKEDVYDAIREVEKLTSMSTKELNDGQSRQAPTCFDKPNKGNCSE